MYGNTGARCGPVAASIRSVIGAPAEAFPWSGGSSPVSFHSTDGAAAPGPARVPQGPISAPRRSRACDGAGVDHASGVEIPDAELHWRFSRAGGPGGQGVNTTDSRVELSFDLASSRSLPPVLRERALARLDARLVGGVLTVVASEHREQLRNRAAARARLLALLRDATAPPKPHRRPTRPTLASQRRRLEGKARRGRLKQERRSTE